MSKYNFDEISCSIGNELMKHFADELIKLNFPEMDINNFEALSMIGASIVCFVDNALTDSFQCFGPEDVDKDIKIIDCILKLIRKNVISNLTKKHDTVSLQ